MWAALCIVWCGLVTGARMVFDATLAPMGKDFPGITLLLLGALQSRGLTCLIGVAVFSGLAFLLRRQEVAANRSNLKKLFLYGMAIILCVTLAGIVAFVVPLQKCNLS